MVRRKKVVQLTPNETSLGVSFGRDRSRIRPNFWEDFAIKILGRSPRCHSHLKMEEKNKILKFKRIFSRNFSILRYQLSPVKLWPNINLDGLFLGLRGLFLSRVLNFFGWWQKRKAAREIWDFLNSLKSLRAAAASSSLDSPNVPRSLHSWTGNLRIHKKGCKDFKILLTQSHHNTKNKYFC